MIHNKKEDIYIKQSNTNIVLFIHGIFSSHVQFDTLMESFVELGYSIYAVALEGHGGESKELNHVNSEVWISQIDSILDDLLLNYKNVYIISHSLGSLLTINATNVNKTKKIVLLSPAIKPKVTLQSMKLGLFLDNKNATDPYILENRKIRGVSFKGLKKIHSIKPLLALFKIVNMSKDKCQNIKTDTLISISKNDESVRFKSGEYIYKNIQSKNKELLTFIKSYHTLLDNEEEITFNKKIINFIKN